MEKHYVTRYSVKQVCQILDIQVPECCQDFQDERLENMACSLKFVKEGGAFFLGGKGDYDPVHLIEKAIEENVRVLFVNEDLRDEPLLQQIPHVLVESVSAATRAVSSVIRDSLDMKVIGVTEIAANAFRGCKGLERVVIPSTVGRIGKNAFLGCNETLFEICQNPYAMERLRQKKNLKAVALPVAKKGFLAWLKRGFA